MSSPPFDESQFVEPYIFEISSPPPSSTETSPTGHPDTMPSEVLGNLYHNEAEVQVNATQFLDDDDSLRHRVEKSQLDENISVPWHTQDKSPTRNPNLATKASQTTANQFRVAATASLNEKPITKHFHKLLSTSIENIGEDFVFTPGHLVQTGHVAKAQPKHESSISTSGDPRLRDDTEGIKAQAPKIRVRGGVSGTRGLTTFTHDRGARTSNRVTTHGHDETGLEAKVLVDGDTSSSTRFSLGATSTASKSVPPFGSAPSSKPPKPPVPPFPSAAMQAGDSQTPPQRFDAPRTVENQHPKLGPESFQHSEKDQTGYRQDVENPPALAGAHPTGQNNRKESSFEKAPRNDLKLPQQQNELPMTRRQGPKSVHRSRTLTSEDIDDEISRDLTPPRRPMSVISASFTHDQDPPLAPKAVDIFQWGVEMLREERDQAMSKDLTIRKYDKRIEELTNKYSLANHRIQELIEARAEAEKKAERLMVGSRLVRASLDRINEEHRDFCVEFQKLKGKDDSIASKFREHEAQSQRREEEIRSHYSQLLREQATTYGKDLEGLQEVEDTLRVELEVRMRELQEQKGMVGQANKHIEEEKTRYSELKNQLSTYESNVLEKLDANSNAFNDLAKSYESRQSSINDRLSSIEKNSSGSPLATSELNARFQAQLEAIRKDQDALGELNRQITGLRTTNEAQSKELDRSQAEVDELRKAVALKDQELVAARSATNERTKTMESLQKLRDRNMKLEQAINTLKKQLSERNDKAKIADLANLSLKDEVNKLSNKLQEQQPIYESTLIRTKKELGELHAKEIADLTAQMSSQTQKQKDNLTKATGDRDFLSLQLSTVTKNYEEEVAGIQVLREQISSWKADKSDFESRAAMALDQIAPREGECNEIASNIKSLEARVDALRHALQSANLNPKPVNKRSFEMNPQAGQQISAAKRQKLQPAKFQTGGLRSSSRSSGNNGLSCTKKDHPEDDSMRIRSFTEIEGSDDEGQQEQPRNVGPVTSQKPTTTMSSAGRAISYTTLAPPQESSDERSRHFTKDPDASNYSQNSYQPSQNSSRTPSVAHKIGESKPGPGRSEPAEKEPFSSPPRVTRRREKRKSMKSVSFEAAGVRAQASGPDTGRDQLSTALPRRSLKRN